MTKLHTSLLLAAIAACATSDAKIVKIEDIRVELAAVTLADDCGPRTPPPSVVAPPSTPPVPSKTPAARCAGPNCGRGNCNQTSMQLAIHTEPDIKSTTIKIKKVELLDPKGVVLEVLTARAPARWTDKGEYVAWDEKIDAGTNYKTMYDLTTPNWDKLTGGRYNAQTKTFQLRVTVLVGTGSRTIEKQSITPTRIPPAVPT